MTSNQIQFAYNQEVARHNKETEELERENQRIQEEANKQIKRYQTAQVLIGVSNELNKAGGVANQSMANLVNSTKTQVEAQNMYAQRKLQSRQLDITERMNTESIRHMHEQDRLTLKEIGIKDYMATLQARMNEATISHMLFEEQEANAKMQYNQAQLVMAQARQENENFRTQIEAAQTVINGNRLLMDQQKQKYQIPIDIVNAQAQVLRALSSTILKGF